LHGFTLLSTLATRATLAAIAVTRALFAWGTIFTRHSFTFGCRGSCTLDCGAAVVGIVGCSRVVACVVCPGWTAVALAATRAALTATGAGATFGALFIAAIGRGDARRASVWRCCDVGHQAIGLNVGTLPCATVTSRRTMFATFSAVATALSAALTAVVAAFAA